MAHITICDRKTWPAGEWDDEPDAKDWTDQPTGYSCLALRHLELGHWCGYVGVPKDHPAYGLKGEDLDLPVYGGITYAFDHAPMHKPDEHWWIGFDCCHYGDVSPAFLQMDLEGVIPRRHRGSYRPLPYVETEIEVLAVHLHAMVPVANER